MEREGLRRRHAFACHRVECAHHLEGRAQRIPRMVRDSAASSGSTGFSSPRSADIPPPFEDIPGFPVLPTRFSEDDRAAFGRSRISASRDSSSAGNWGVRWQRHRFAADGLPHSGASRRARGKAALRPPQSKTRGPRRTRRAGQPLPESKSGRGLPTQLARKRGILGLRPAAALGVVRVFSRSRKGSNCETRGTQAGYHATALESCYSLQFCLLFAKEIDTIPAARPT